MVLMTKERPLSSQAAGIDLQSGQYRVVCVTTRGREGSLTLYHQGQYLILGFSEIPRPESLLWQVLQVVHGDGHILTLWRISQDNYDLADLLSLNFSPQPELAPRLEAICRSITHPSLRRFLNHLFADVSLVKHFFSIGASWHHHHADPGDLLRHSIEAAEYVIRVLSESPLHPLIIQCSILAALLHDIGKVSTHGKVDGPTIFQSQDHEAAGILMLSPHLEVIHNDRDTYELLGYLLLADAGAVKSQVVPTIDTIRSADRFSAQLDCYQNTFKNRPPWQRFAKYEEDGRVFYRPGA